VGQTPAPGGLRAILRAGGVDKRGHFAYIGTLAEHMDGPEKSRYRGACIISGSPFFLRGHLVTALRGGVYRVTTGSVGADYPDSDAQNKRS